MIQHFLAEELKKVLPDLEWTADYYTADDHTGTVYSEGGGQSDINNESGTRYPNYMVYIRSSAWSYAETAAQKVYDTLHLKKNFVAVVEQFDKDENVIGTKSYHVFLVSATSDPLRLGAVDKVMEFSININVTLTEIKEEMPNA